MSAAEIILCTMGTRGDALPFVALSQELGRRGLNVTLLANANWRGLAGEAGAGFHAIAPKDPSQSGRDDNAFFVDSTLPAFRKSFDYVAERARQNRRILLVYRANMLGMESAAEKYGLRHIKIALQPSSIKSLARPPWPMTSLVEGRFAGVMRKAVVPVLYQLVEWRRGHYRHRNKFRATLGLPPHKLGRMGAQTEDLTLLFAPKWFAMPAEDWPGNLRCTGFLFHDRDATDPAIDAFVANHGAPLVFTPGSGVSNVAPFFKKALQICEAGNFPGIFLSPQPFDMETPQVPVLKIDFAELSAVLPKARLLAHHGGIGTTAQALRAGIPQIIVPDRFDQPDNAIRIAKLGLGAAILKDEQTPEEWATLIHRLLAATEIQQRLKTVSRAIVRNDALIKSCDLIEDLLRKVMEV
ncbi:glycosyltransferase [Asticcacaulis taihuensis]|uniref:glycosyltransferase n=1 Tax=Asticcacaulis taihuensis TaxID=260084 RepID=UPI003F7C6074